MAYIINGDHQKSKAKYKTVSPPAVREKTYFPVMVEAATETFSTPPTCTISHLNKSFMSEWCDSYSAHIARFLGDEAL